MAYNWTCPHCSRPQIVTDSNQHYFQDYLRLTPIDLGDVGVGIRAVACLNKDCTKLTLEAHLKRWENRRAGTDYLKAILCTWRLIPESTAVPQPEYIPAPLVEDYREACRIRDLSSKASATLARRCLQGMIRDFSGIARGTLDAEIKALRSQVEAGNAPTGVTPESIDAIDHVRSVGNVGAHMEKDINLIVEVDPGEAQALIELIEMLFEEWYVARHERQQKLARVAAIAAEKKAVIADAQAQEAQRRADNSERGT